MLVRTALLAIVIAGWALLAPSHAEQPSASHAGNRNLSGAWKTNWADLSLTQKDATVAGAYAYKGGQLRGTITGNRLNYTWTQTDGKKGRGYFIISDDWNSIAGRYGYNDDDSGGGEWTGKRLLPAAPAAGTGAK